MCLLVARKEAVEISLIVKSAAPAAIHWVSAVTQYTEEENLGQYSTAAGLQHLPLEKIPGNQLALALGEIPGSEVYPIKCVVFAGE